jgi:uncharacterized surface protein with fasciclin (FAS1) repeats
VNTATIHLFKPNKMRKQILALAAACLVAGSSIAQNNSTASERTVEVGGAPMYPSKNIIENAVNSKDHTTLVAAVKAAGLVEALMGAGPFTVFAPTNEAFEMLPAGTVETLLKEENKALLTKILTYHVVSGKYSAAEIARLAQENNGSVTLSTLSGGQIWIMKKGDKWMLKDEKGNQAKIRIADVFQSNGVIHVIDKVIMPAN